MNTIFTGEAEALADLAARHPRRVIAAARRMEPHRARLLVAVLATLLANERTERNR